MIGLYAGYIASLGLQFLARISARLAEIVSKSTVVSTVLLITAVGVEILFVSAAVQGVVWKVVALVIGGEALVTITVGYYVRKFIDPTKELDLALCQMMDLEGNSMEPMDLWVRAKLAESRLREEYERNEQIIKRNAKKMRRYLASLDEFTV